MDYNYDSAQRLTELREAKNPPVKPMTWLQQYEYEQECKRLAAEAAESDRKTTEQQRTASQPTYQNADQSAAALAAIREGQPRLDKWQLRQQKWAKLNPNAKQW